MNINECIVSIPITPEADVSSYDCEECGLSMPSEPPRKVENNWTNSYPYSDVCPHCAGRVVYNGYFNKHGSTPPSC